MTTSAWLSPVQIHDSALLGTSFAINSDYDSRTPVVTMTVSLQIEHPEKRGKLNLSKCVFGFMGVWHEPDDEDNVAFTIGCTMGLTASIPDDAFAGDFTAERINKTVDANAVSLVYAKIRSFIEDLTAQSPIGRQTIPAIEPYALLESLQEQVDFGGTIKASE